MPPSSLWPFLKELFFNRQTIGFFVKRQKLTALLMFAFTVLTVMFLFVWEQAIQRQALLVEYKQKLVEQEMRLANLKQITDENIACRKEVGNCQNQLSLLQSDYRELNHTLFSCSAAPSVVIPPVRPSRPRVKLPKPSTPTALTQ